MSDSAKPLFVQLAPDVLIIHGDCRDVLPTLAFDAVVADPPYGIGFVKGPGGNGFNCNTNYKPIIGDDIEFDPTHLLELEGLTKNGVGRRAVVLMGANHYCARLPHRGQWLVWDKSCGQGPAVSFVDAEFIWMNRRNPRCIFRHLWMGAVRAGDCNSNRIQRMHPSMKPPELMAWLIETARIGIGKTVCDPYMGSGTTGLACLRSGRKFIGIEIDEEYFEISRARLTAELARLRPQSEETNP